MSPERPLEEVIVEPAFAELLQAHAKPFCELRNALGGRTVQHWTKRDFHQLANEANALESFLDDHGAKFNRTYSLVRELVACTRWLALAGFSLAHLEGRFESYGLNSSLTGSEVDEAQRSFTDARQFLTGSIERLMERLRVAFDRLSITWAPGRLPDGGYGATEVKRRLPRNIGQEELTDDSQRIAEIASKYLAACSMLENLGVQRIADAETRRRKLAAMCKEEQARVYEATVHNLQSTYDTYIKNTVVEGRDDRLPRLRGHLSASLHLLESATVLTHFVERHELEVRGEATEHAIGRLIDRDRVQDLILNHLLYWANAFMLRGRVTAEELLPNYIEMQELHVELPDNLKLHARPAALIVNIVSHFGTPVEMEVAGHRCNAGSILELLVAVGSNPEARQYTFRGDVHPLRDISLLFEGSLGEDGLDNLPAQLQYLKSR